MATRVTPGRQPTRRAAQSRAAALLNNPDLIRAVFRPIQRYRPTLALGSRYVVTRHADVCEVLERDEDFTIAEVNGAKMDTINGPFMLGMDRGPQYLREKGILQRAARPDDLEAIRAHVRAAAADAVAAVRHDGRIDVVQQLARPVAVGLVATYFGVPGPDQATMLRWMRTIFHETFLNVGGDPHVRQAGEQSAEEFHAYADALIAARREEIDAGKEGPDDFLTRLVAFQADPDTRLSDESVRRNVGGVVVGAVETTNKAVAHALDQLLRRPSELRGAVEAAEAGDLDLVRAYTFEAMRFNPLNPVLARHVARTSVVAAGTRRECRMPAGRSVYVGVMPAMFDPDAFPDPDAFRVDRPLSAYLHFGHGLHTCFGERINLVQIPELVAAALRLPGLRRAPGPDGQIAYDGPFPDRLVLEFDR